MGNLKSKKSSIKQNYAYNLIYQISTIIVPLITLPYVSRIFHASGIGIYSYTLSIVTYFSMFSVLGIAVYGQLEIAKFRDNIEKRSKIFLEIIYTRIILGFIIMLLYSLLIIFSKEYKMMYIIMSFNILGSLADISWYFQGMEQFKPIALKNTFIKIFGAILIMTIIKRESQIYLYAAILQGTYFLGNASLWPNLKNSIVKTNIDKNSVINHLKKSFIYFIPSFATSIYTVLDKSMIGWLSTSNAQNGYYEQAHKIEQVLVTLVTSLGTVTMPRIAYLQQEKKNEKIKEIVNNAIEFVCFLSFPIFIGIISISNRLIPFFLGNGYDECIKLLNVFSLLIVIVGLNNIIGKQCLMGMGRQKDFNKGVIIGAIANLILNIVLIRKYYSFGAAIASVIAEFLILLCFIYKSIDLIDIKKMLINIFKYFSVSLLMGVLLFVISNTLNLNDYYVIIIELLCGVLYYMATLFILKDKMILLGKEIFTKKMKELGGKVCQRK